jgi:hypothetical protein
MTRRKQDFRKQEGWCFSFIPPAPFIAKKGVKQELGRGGEKQRERSVSGG